MRSGGVYNLSRNQQSFIFHLFATTRIDLVASSLKNYLNRHNLMYLFALRPKITTPWANVMTQPLWV
jgi:hypothetical protein